MPRPSLYTTMVKPHLPLISKWARTMNERQIAEKLGIDKTTLTKYKDKHPELVEAIINGKQDLESDMYSELILSATNRFVEETNNSESMDKTGALTITKTTYKKFVKADIGAIIVVLKQISKANGTEFNNYATDELKQKLAELKIKQQNADKDSW